MATQQRDRWSLGEPLGPSEVPIGARGHLDAHTGANRVVREGGALVDLRGARVTIDHAHIVCGGCGQVFESGHVELTLQGRADTRPVRLGCPFCGSTVELAASEDGAAPRGQGHWIASTQLTAPEPPHGVGWPQMSGGEVRVVGGRRRPSTAWIGALLAVVVLGVALAVTAASTEDEAMLAGAWIAVGVGMAGLAVLAARSIPRRGVAAAVIGALLAAGAGVLVPATAATDRCQDLSAGADLAECDLAGRDLSGRDLANTDLSGAVLVGTDLTGADLDGADLANADLADATLRQVTGEGAVFAGAGMVDVDLTGASLRDADFGGADLTAALLVDAELAGATFGGATLSGADLTGAALAAADLGGVDLEGALLDGADLTGADLGGARLTRTSAGGTVFAGAVLAGADLGGSFLSGADFSDADLSTAVLFDVVADGARFVGTSLAGADLTSADLSRADLSGSALDGATFLATRLTATVGLTDAALAGALGVAEADLAAAVLDRDLRFDDLGTIIDAMSPVAAGTGVAGVRPYAPSPGFHPLIAVAPLGGGFTPDWAASSQGRWAPEALRFVELVAVTDESSEVLEVCLYNGPSITRYREAVHVRVVAAATGQVVGEQTFLGTAPRECRPTEPYSLTELYGDPVDYSAEVLPFVEGFVHPPA